MSLASAIRRIREITKGTDYEGQLFLVGGYVRDRVMGLTSGDDIDIVLEGDGVALARFLHQQGVSRHAPVLFPRFGTAKLEIDGVDVEIVGARAESYAETSRKPTVERAGLMEDAKRRDFTVNTLLENLQTGETLDLLGRALSDLAAGVIVTPLDPETTFRDDPLRMLRAVRFAVRLGFRMDENCAQAIRDQAGRLGIVSGERIREEFTKMLVGPEAGRSLRMLQELGLLAEFAPELQAMVGVDQNEAHLWDVWEHTVRAVEALPPSAGLNARLAMLLHDVGKPQTKTVDEQGDIHFYQHEAAGLEPTTQFLTRLRFPNDIIQAVLKLVRMHMRPGGYSPLWSDGAVRRLLRDAGPAFDDLMLICRADAAARRPDAVPPQLDALLERVRRVEAEFVSAEARSPLTGKEIMEHLGIGAGMMVGRLKLALEEAVLEGNLTPEDKPAAYRMIEALHGVSSGDSGL